MHRAALRAARVIAIGSNGQIGHAVPVQITHRRHRNPKGINIRKRRTAVRAAGDLQESVGDPTAGQGNGKRVILDLAVAGRADGVFGGGIGAQAEACVGGAREAGRNCRERQGEATVARAVGDGDLSAFSGVVEDAVVVEVDPAGQRRRAAGRVGGEQRDRRLRPDRAEQIVRRIKHTVLVVRQCTVHVVRVRSPVLQCAVVTID